LRGWGQPGAPQGCVEASPSLADLNVLILTYGAANKHKELVDAVTESGVSPRQIVLIHNPDGSVDGARPWAPPDASTLIMPRNVGYGHAMNAGIKFAAERGADWLLLLTHDVQFADSGLANLLAARERGDGFAVLGPALMRADTGGVYSFGGMDDAKTLVRHITDEPAPVDGIAECLWIDGCAMLVRSAPVIAAGMMRGEFFMYFDEPELCLRIRRLGWKVGVVTEAGARTSPGGFSRPAAYGYLFCRNGLAYALAAGGRRGLLSGAISQVRLAFRTLLTPNRRDFYRPRHQLTSLSRVVGIGLGFVAFFAGRWGPPPSLLQRLGDIGGT
jgi:glycosyltransferase involved in cell wall biosynthesis